MIQAFSLMVIVVLVVAAIWVVLALAMWPGKVARRRRHPYAEAVELAGWLGILVGGLLWPFALIWAYATPWIDKEQNPAPSPDLPPRKRLRTKDS